MSDVVWQDGRFRVERTGDPDAPYRYMYSPPGGIPFRLGVKDPEVETLIRCSGMIPRRKPHRVFSTTSVAGDSHDPDTKETMLEQP